MLTEISISYFASNLLEPMKKESDYDFIQFTRLIRVNSLTDISYFFSM